MGGFCRKGVEHEATEAFFSEDGRARTKAQIDQREDCFVLKEGLGAAFLVEPASGTLPPWGVVKVAVTVFNDTPGRYSDKVDITFTGTSPPITARERASERARGCLNTIRSGLQRHVPSIQLKRMHACMCAPNVFYILVYLFL